MSCIFLEGWEKYGGTNTGTPIDQTLLVTGDWTASTAGGSATLVAGLNGNGMALQISGGPATLSRTFGTNYPRLIGGFQFNPALAPVPAGITFLDVATAQCSITFNNGGSISIRNGQLGGTAIATTATGLIAANSTHDLAWDIQFANSGSYSIYLDGNPTPILTGTGDTTGTANNYANAFQIGSSAGAHNVIWDNIYLFDTSGGTNNAVVLTNPRVETSWATTDSAVQSGFGAATLGSSVRRNASTYTAAANGFYVRAFRPAVNCTIGSVSWFSNATNGTINVRPVLYTDNSGVPGTLMTSGSTVTGMTTGLNVLPLTTPQNLTAGVQYWLGLMTDVTQTAFAYFFDASNAGRTATVTFSGGAPSTAPATTGGATTIMVWGNLTATAASWFQVAPSPTVNPPPLAGQSYLTDTVVGHKDLMGFSPPVIAPTNVYAVAVKALVARSDTGARTMSVRQSLSGTEVAGATFTPGTTYGWVPVYRDVDPSGAAWTPATLSNVLGGYGIVS